MEHYGEYPVLIVDSEIGTHSAVAAALGTIRQELESRGLTVFSARSRRDAEIKVETNASLGCLVADWALGPDLRPLIDRVHQLGEAIPVLVVTEGRDVEDIPLDLAERASGFLWVGEDTAAFIAGRIEQLVVDYAQRLLSPFFGALKRYVDNNNYVWSCPGHNGGMFYRKTPLGRVFFDFVGEDFMRADLCNASPELGSILQHQGPVLEAERRAAEIFGAERTYFVLNGTSTSNKIVTMGLIAPGDLVLFDRNCHKSVHHGALMMAGGMSTTVTWTRTTYASRYAATRS